MSSGAESTSTAPSNSIVRTEATRLRTALAKYYDADGATDAIRILLPPGSYVPRFERKAVAETASDPGAAASTRSQSAEEKSFLPFAPTFGPRLVVGASAAAAIIVVASILAMQPFRQWWPIGTMSLAPVIVVAITQPIGDAPNIHGLAAGLNEFLALTLTRYSGLAIARASERRPPDAILASSPKIRTETPIFLNPRSTTISRACAFGGDSSTHQLKTCFGRIKSKSHSIRTPR